MSMNFIRKKILHPLGVLRSTVFRKLIANMTRKALMKNRERDKIILSDFIMEADTSPQDEFELFKFIYNKKDSEFTPYYIMNEDSPCYPEIRAQYGENIIPYSHRNRIKFSFGLVKLFKTTKYICSGFKVMQSLNMGITEAAKESPYVYSVFTQHGVTFFKDEFITPATYSPFFFDKIMISNDFEKEIFKNRSYCEDKHLFENGLFRWDLLSSEKQKSEKSIFIYFTHRRYLKDIDDVQNSVYVETIAGLLKDPRFIELVAKHGYTLKVALHHTVLSVCGSNILEGVHILEDAEIADAKRDSAILITDYSSMCFEMWFQHKPVIFLNVPDGEDCIEYGHSTDLPAPYLGKEDYIFNVVDTIDDCINMLSDYFDSDFEFSASDKEKRDKFFYYNSDFCQRFYDFIVASKNEKKVLHQMALNQYIQFSTYSDIHTKGITFPDRNGRWITEKKAEIGFHIPHTDKDIAIKLRGSAYLRYKQYEVKLKFYVNGHYMQSAKLSSRKGRGFLFVIPNSWFRGKDYINIEIRVSHVYRRKYLKVKGEDMRYLSFRLTSMDIIEVDPALGAEEQIKLIEDARRDYALEESALTMLSELKEQHDSEQANS